MILMEQTAISSNASSQSFSARIIRFLGIILTLGLTLAFIVAYSTQYFSDSVYTELNTYYSPAVAGIAFIMIFLRAYTSPKGANSRKAYFGITLAVFFYLLGEVFYILPGVADNYPSIADLFWAIGTIFFIDELFFIVSVINVRFSKKQLTFIYGLTALSVVTIIIFAFGEVIVQPYITERMVALDSSLEVYTPFMKAMDLFYFTGDVLILFGTIYVTFGLFSKTGFKLSFKHLAWIFLILGNVSMIFGDTFYSYFNLKGALTINLGSFYTLILNPGDHSIDNVLYVFQYMFWALSFSLFPEYLSRSFSSTVEQEFIPVETKENMDFTVPSVSDALSDTPPTVSNTLSLSEEPQPSGDQNMESG